MKVILVNVVRLNVTAPLLVVKVRLGCCPKLWQLNLSAEKTSNTSKALVHFGVTQFWSKAKLKKFCLD